MAEAVETPHLEPIPSTPEDADRALESLFSTRFFQPASIHSYYEAKQSFWSRFAPSPTPREVTPTIFIATQNPEKQNRISTLAEQLQIGVAFSPRDAHTNEAAVQKLSFIKTATPYEQAEAYAANKEPTSPLQKVLNKRGQPYLGFDTVTSVYHPDPTHMKTMWKPKNHDEARAYVTAIADKEVLVYSGIVLSMQSARKNLIHWPMGVGIRMRIIPLSPEDIEQFLTASGEQALQVSGGVDYASALGQKLIAPDSIRILPVETNLTGVPKDADWYRGIQIAHTALPILEPYFKGVPTHAVKQILPNVTNVLSDN